MTDAGNNTPPAPIKVFTIGFAGHSAEEFFGKLQRAGVKMVFDVRLSNVSQLAGFAKKRDIEYFLQTIAGISYVHEKGLAPTKDILDDYKNKRIEWTDYEERFNRLLLERQPHKGLLRPDELDGGCLLCSEHEPEHCHRRLVAEYLQREWENVEIIHL